MLLDVPTIDRTYATARDLFELPQALKDALSRPQDDQVRGYSGVGDERAA